jgi:hypothetical protein
VTWTHIASGPVVITSSGTTVTGTCASSAAGNQMTAHLNNSSGAATWTLPAGWLRATDGSGNPAHAANSGNDGADIWYLPPSANAGGITTVLCTSSASARLEVQIDEDHTDVASPVITVTAVGTGVAGAVATCPVALGSAANAGDLVKCCFHRRLTAAAVVAWTTPTGFTLSGDDTASATHHLFAAYQLAAAGGAQTVTGKTGAAADNAFGWAGTVATFTAAPAGAVAAGGLVGVFVNPAIYAPVATTTQQGYAKWSTATSRANTVVRQYFGTTVPPLITADMKAFADAGITVCVNLNPAYNPPTTSDLDAIGTLLASCKAYNPNFNVVVTLWGEPHTQQANGQTGLVAAFPAMWAFYAPTVRQYFPCVVNFGSFAVKSQGELAVATAGVLALCDGLAVDYYCESWVGDGSPTNPATQTSTLDMVSALADAQTPKLSVGIYEFNSSLNINPATGLPWQSVSQAVKFITYLSTWGSARLTASKPLGHYILFDSGFGSSNLNSPVLAGDPRIAPWQAMFDLLNSATSATTLNITTGSVPDGVVGTAYPSTTLASVGGTPAYTYAVTAGTLPTSLALSGAGVITGTPTVAGVYSFSVTVTDSLSHTDTQAYTVTISATAGVTITTSSLPAGEAGSAYSATLAATGGTPAYTWIVLSGALPAGVALSTGGVLSGTPTAAGAAAVTFQVTDVTSGTSTVTLTVTVAARLAVSPAALPGGTIGTPYSQTAAAAGGTGTLTWSVSAGTLPASLALNTATGVISGTPTVAGTSAFTITIADAYTTAARALSITIAALQVTTTALPNGVARAAYSQALAASGGTPAYTWAVTAGALPSGVTLSSAGLLAGIPVQAGLYAFTVTVTDSLAATAAAALSLQVLQSGDSLLLTPDIELLAGGVTSTIPACAGAMFRLAPGFSLSAPQPTSNMVASMLDGERPSGTPHAGNRTPALPVVISGPSRAVVAAGREVLIRAVSAPGFTLTWTRDQGLPLVFDCFSAEATVVDYDLAVDRVFFATLAVTFQAHPYGRSDQPVIVPFPVPLAGQVPPPPAQIIDNFATVSGTRWSQSLLGPGPFSAHYDPAGSGTGLTASYTRSGIGPLNLTGLNGLTVAAGFGSSSWWSWWGQGQRGPVQVAFTLSDGTHSSTTHVTRKVRASADSSNPAWQVIRVPVPAGGGLNLAAVTGYTIRISNRQAGDLQFTDVYLDTLRAVAYATTQAVQPSSGTIIDLAGIAGSARSAVSLQLTQPATTVQTVTRRWTTPGTYQWRPGPTTTAVQRAECYGPGGIASGDTSGGYRGGGGGAEYAAEPGLPVTPGAASTIIVPHGGHVPGGTAEAASFTSDLGVVVTAHGGVNQTVNTGAGSSGGTGYVPVQQLAGTGSSFDGGIGNWTGTGNAAVAADATQHQAGSGSLKLTSVAAGDMSAGSCGTASYLTAGEPCDPLFPVVVNGFAKASTVGRLTALGSEFWDSNGVSLATTFGADTSDVTTGFTAQAQATLTPPAGAVWYRVRGRVKATGAAAEVHWFDTITTTSGVAHAGGTGGTGGSGAGGGGGGAGGPSGAGSAGQNGSAGGLGGPGGGGDAGQGGQGGALVGAAFAAGSPGRRAGAGGGGAGPSLGGPPGGGLGGDAEVAVTFQQTAGFRTLVLHRPGFDAPDTFAPFCRLSATDVPDGTTEYALPSLIDGTAARFGDADKPFTTSVYAVASAWHNSSAPRTVTATVRQYEQAGGTVYAAPVTATITPANLASPMCLLGELTLPVSAMPSGNTSGYFTVSVTSGDTADRFQDALFLDTMGSSVIIESPVGYTQYWVDEPAGSADLGNIMGSAFGRESAVSVLAHAQVSGPPLHVDPFGNQTLMAYSVEGAPACWLTHWPKWILERLA